MWERVLDLSELSRLQPPAPLLSFMCAARRGPTTKSWLAPPIRARDQAGHQRPSLWPLDARWGQSNTSKCPSLGKEGGRTEREYHRTVTVR
jgi:hypothetical protein